MGGGWVAGAASVPPPLVSCSGSFTWTGAGTGGDGSVLTGRTGEAFLSFLGERDSLSLSRDLLLFLRGSGFFSGTSLLASTPMLVATASIACISKDS